MTALGAINAWRVSATESAQKNPFHIIWKSDIYLWIPFQQEGTLDVANKTDTEREICLTCSIKNVCIKFEWKRKLNWVTETFINSGMRGRLLHKLNGKTFPLCDEKKTRKLNHFSQVNIKFVIHNINLFRLRFTKTRCIIRFCKWLSGTKQL